MISVIITSYNYGHFLQQAIDSVIDQTYADFELIIINDGSVDDTEAVVLSNSDQRIRYYYQENLGQPKAKNKGIEFATGEFLAFLDADDVWLPDKLEKQINLFSNLDVGVVYSRRKWITSVGSFVSGNERLLHRGWILDYIFVDNFVCFSSSVIRRSFLDKVGFFDENIPMGIDYDLWIRLASVCKFDFVDEPLVQYRIGHSNLSQNTIKRYECAQLIMRKNLANPHVTSSMSWYVPRLAWADTWSNFGYYLATIGNKKEGGFYALRAICKFPFYLNAYKRFIKIILVK